MTKDSPRFIHSIEISGQAKKNSHLGCDFLVLVLMLL